MRGGLGAQLRPHGLPDQAGGGLQAVRLEGGDQHRDRGGQQGPAGDVRQVSLQMKFGNIWKSNILGTTVSGRHRKLWMWRAGLSAGCQAQ